MRGGGGLWGQKQTGEGSETEAYLIFIMAIHIKLAASPLFWPKT